MPTQTGSIDFKSTKGFQSYASGQYTTKTEFNNLEIGGRNLLKYSRDYNDGVGYSSSAAESGIDGSYHGCSVWKAVKTATNAYNEALSTDASKVAAWVVGPDEDYVLSFWAKASAQLQVYSYFYLGGNNTCDKVETSTGYSGANTDGSAVTTIGTDWKRYWVHWHFNSSTDPTKRKNLIIARMQNAVTGTVWIAGPKLEKGSKATDWSPAPEDATERIVKAETAIEQTANNVLIKATQSDTTAAQGGQHIIESLINVAPSGVRIAADKVNIEGAAIFTSGRLTNANIAKTANTVPDTRNRNEPPSWYFENYPRQSVTEFKVSSVMGLTGEAYCFVTTVTGWSDKSGGYPKQTAQIASKSYWRVGVSDSAWGEWQEVESTAGAQGKAEAAVDSLEIGGTNILRNTKGEWSNVSSTASWKRYDVANPTLTPNVDYTVSFDAKTSNGTDVFYIGFAISDSTQEILAQEVRASTSYQRMSFTAQTTKSTINAVLVSNAKAYGHGNGNNTGGTLYIKNFKLERGSKATDWTPAPEDTDSAIASVEDAIPTKVSELSNDSGFATTTQAQGYANTAKSEAIAAGYANMGFQFRKDIVVYGDSDKYYPVYLNNTQSEYSQTVPHEVLITRGYSEQAPSDWNTSTHKGGLNLRLRWNYGGWGGATYVCQIYDFSESYSTMLGDVLVGNKSGMNSTVYLRGGGTTGALYHIYSEVSLENTRYGATFPYIGTNTPGTVYMQSGSYTWSVDSPLTAPNTAHILSLAATVDEQYIYISKAVNVTAVSGTTTWVTTNSDTQNAWTTKRPTYNTSYPVLFVAKQRKTAFGLVTCTTPVKDDTTTIIDGGHIITGTVNANAINATSGTFNEALIPNLTASKILVGSSSLNNVLDSKADNSDIPTKVSQLNNDSGYQTSTQMSAAIGNALDAIEIGGRNLLRNSLEMKLGTSSWKNGVWRVAGNADMTKSHVVISDGPLGQCGGLQLVGTQTTTSDTSCYGIDSMPRDIGGDYVISMFARVVGGGVARAGFTIYSATYVDGNDDGRWASYYTKTLDTTGKWTRIWEHWKSTAATGNVYIGGAATDTSSKTIQMCLVQIERGTKPTDWTPAPEEMVRRTQRIWYRKEVAGAPATPSSWVVKPDDGSNVWTKMHIAITETEKFIYTCEQYEMGDGTVGYTSVLLDNTITVIDGGKIITGSVTANQLSANAVTAEKIAANALTLGKFTSADKLLVDNSQVHVGGRNLLLATSDPKELTTTTSDTNKCSYYTFSEYGYSTVHGSGLSTVMVSFDWETTGTSGTIRVQTNASPWSSAIAVTISSTQQSGHASLLMSVPSTWATTTFSGFGVRLDNIGGTTTIKNFKMEVGNKATDWSPAPEDQTEYVNASTGKLSDDITSMSKTYDDQIGELGKRADGVDGQITGIKTTLANDKALRDNWIRMDEYGIFVGSNSSTYGVGIDADSVDFMVGGEKAAYASADAFVPKALRLGDYVLSGSGGFLYIDYQPQQTQ